MSHSIKEELKKSVIELIKDLKILFPEDQLELTGVEFFFLKMPSDEILNKMNLFVVPHKQMVEKKNKQFFINNKALFSGLPQSRVDYYSKKLSSDSFDKEECDTLFEYFESFITFCEKIKKEK